MTWLLVIYSDANFEKFVLYKSMKFNYFYSTEIYPFTVADKHFLNKISKWLDSHLSFYDAPIEMMRNNHQKLSVLIHDNDGCIVL
jgi:hypothetical protein